MFLALALIACEAPMEKEETVTEEKNPLLESFDAPFGIPPFGEIENHHFEPALERAMLEHKREIDAIVASKGAPDFENTIVALDNAGSLYDRVNTVFGNLNSAHTNDEMQAIAKKMAPLKSAHSDDILLNAALFARVQKVWDDRESLELNPEQMQLLEKTYKRFTRSGANLGVEDKERLREINSKLSSLQVQFGQNVLAETNNYELVISDEADLAGLPQNVIDAAAEAAADKGHEGWLFTLHNPSVMPFLHSADNRELRRQIWEAYVNRANNGNEYDNNEVVKEMVALRIEKAKMLGYDNHAAYVLEERMAESPEKAMDLLKELWGPALQSAQREAEDLQALIHEEGGDFQVLPSDWRYYSNKLKQSRFELSDEEVKPYFSIDNVREGIFTVTEKLWGLTYKEREDLPRYHPDVNVFEVMDADGSHLGILFEDLHARESKRGGAWMTSYRKQFTESGQRKAPLISIVCNFPKASGDNPALLTFDEVTTYFHEFGHALHGLMSDVTYQTLAGTSVPTDFVELPSQVLENWATHPDVMRMYAKHYQTGEVIPDALIQKLENSGTYGQGFATVEYLASSFLDMDYHTLEEGFEGSAMDFEDASMQEIGLISAIVPRHRSTYFGHIFSGGYSAGYYSYIWSGVLDTDAFAAFEETDLFDAEKAKLFRDHILSQGGTRDAMEMYVAFRGQEPTIDALLKKRGLAGGKELKK